MTYQPERLSLIQSLALLPASEQKRAISSLTEEQAAQILKSWRSWARPEQIEPSGDWSTWLILAGRGWGKTRTGAEWILEQVHKPIRAALVGPTSADARDVMVEGESGICSIDRTARYEPSKRRITWPNGAMATIFSADEPDRLRGPQHHVAWADELAAWRYPDAWDQLMLGMRLGTNPRTIVTTTPRPTRIIKELAASETTHVTRGSTYDNRANLAPGFFREIVGRYEGTRLGRQELHAEILDDVPGALWQREQIDRLRTRAAPDLKRTVVAIDPAVTSGENADETGIIVAGKGRDEHGYVLADLTCRESPDGWARKAVAAYHRFEANMVVAEVNNGGDLVERVIHTVDPHVPFKAVRASKGKYTRAEPVAAKYEQAQVHHVGMFAALEDQMCAFTPEGIPGESPDRVDALVWALTELMIEPQYAMRSQEFRI